MKPPHAERDPAKAVAITNERPRRRLVLIPDRHGVFPDVFAIGLAIQSVANLAFWDVISLLPLDGDSDILLPDSNIYETSGSSITNSHTHSCARFSTANA